MRKRPPKNKFDVGRTLATGTVKSPQVPEEMPKQGWSWKKRLLVGLAGLVGVLIIFVATIAIWDWVNISRATKATFGSGNAFSLLSPTTLKGSDKGRINVLVLGNSVDDPQNTGGKLTDSILVVSLSTNGHASYMLSIPRDLYVKSQGFSGKINAAYESIGIKGLENIILADYKIPVDYWVLVDNSAVRDIVNALGGITVNIQSSDPRGLYDAYTHLNLKNGVQTIDGQTALNLSRARCDPGAGDICYGFPRYDYTRTQHQRQVVTAIKSKISWTLILNPLKNGRIFQAFAKDIHTDIGIHEVRPLFSLFHKIPTSKLQSIGLDNFNGRDYYASTNLYGSTQSPAAGVYDFSQIDAALSQLNQQPSGS